MPLFCLPEFLQSCYAEASGLSDGLDPGFPDVHIKSGKWKARRQTASTPSSGIWRKMCEGGLFPVASLWFFAVLCHLWHCASSGSAFVGGSASSRSCFTTWTLPQPSSPHRRDLETHWSQCPGEHLSLIIYLTAFHFHRGILGAELNRSLTLC